MKHIIWDFNGTLLNDAQLSVDLDNDVFDQIGVPRITLEDYRNNMTMPVRDFYPLVGVDYDAHSYEEIARIWLDEFNRKAIGVGLLPGALEAIQRLHAQGRSQSVLSASYEPSLKKQSTEETEENDEPESELIKVSEEEDENGKKQFILKDLLDKGIYLVTAEFDQGTVEYGFEVKKNAKSS